MSARSDISRVASAAMSVGGVFAGVFAATRDSAIWGDPAFLAPFSLAALGFLVYIGTICLSIRDTWRRHRAPSMFPTLEKAAEIKEYMRISEKRGKRRARSGR